MFRRRRGALALSAETTPAGFVRFGRKRAGESAAAEPARRESCELRCRLSAIAKDGMTTRTTGRTVTFQHPFVLDGFARAVPAGAYLVETEEELMDTVLSLAWKRVSTVIRLRTGAGTQHFFIDPGQLEAALLRDQAPPETSTEAAVPATASHSGTRNLVTRRVRNT